ncbi:hypothetical protein CAPTEDRAFT_168806 [Capitella teleta]|uniref:EGF domain-specific O-linked N-acetylglucosamine transferase n=1 Tax=Capitella teleta TaxID=283909 RepID=R7V7I7_CAPTE|nr:hypothetical protein CAPTEDRAFT_168806 [Capitella teleta]|eukprot:ELU12341.1 hypothetical protein CAPTEDRAFT_168806 [Capitella teleta]
MIVFWILLASLLPLSLADVWNNLRLPTEHIPYFFYNNIILRNECKNDPTCPYKVIEKFHKCWGYESLCPERLRMNTPQCPVDAPRGWVRTREEQSLKFWQQGDFGYLKERKEEMQTFCKPRDPEGAMLECSKFARYCRAKNIYIDFSDLKVDMLGQSKRYREDVFSEGQIGGYCDFDADAFSKESEHKSPLQSWYAELEKYTQLSSDPFEEKTCEVIIDKPTIFIKLDAGVNMYHHFCDYINLYLSQHMNNSFSTDVYIVMWDTSPMHYGDFFHVTWKAFSDHEIVPLKEYDGKKVCFKDVVFSFLARMRYGLYYNMPLIPGCQGSSFFRAFNQHILHRLNITQDGPLLDKVRITLLSRSTKFRKILNEDELVTALKSVDDYKVQVVDFNYKTPFLEQLQVTYNSDFFIGMHGAGLTHVLFQPDWAVLFEIYNCEDKDCYKDLAALRGAHYMTWSNQDKITQEDEGHHPTLGAHAKFTNYAFDVDEFLHKVREGVKHIKQHWGFRQARRLRASLIKDEL